MAKPITCERALIRPRFPRSAKHKSGLRKLGRRFVSEDTPVLDYFDLFLFTLCADKIVVWTKSYKTVCALLEKVLLLQRTPKVIAKAETPNETPR